MSSEEVSSTAPGTIPIFLRVCSPLASTATRSPAASWLSTSATLTTGIFDCAVWVFLSSALEQLAPTPIARTAARRNVRMNVTIPERNNLAGCDTATVCVARCSSCLSRVCADLGHHLVRDPGLYRRRWVPYADRTSAALRARISDSVTNRGARSTLAARLCVDLSHPRRRPRRDGVHACLLR